MTEQHDKKEKEESQELVDKRVQHYMVLLTAWINTKMEHDKTLITLSAAAIGLLITVLTTKSVAEAWLIWVYGLAFVGYLTTIVTTLIIFQKNSLYIEKEINNQTNDDQHLERLDKLTIWSFSLATTAFILIGIFSATLKISENNKKKEETQKVANDNEKINLQLEEMKKSMRSLSNLRPIQQQNTSSSNQGHQTTKPDQKKNPKGK